MTGSTTTAYNTRNVHNTPTHLPDNLRDNVKRQTYPCIPFPDLFFCRSLAVFLRSCDDLRGFSKGVTSESRLLGNCGQQWKKTDDYLTGSNQMNIRLL